MALGFLAMSILGPILDLLGFSELVRTTIFIVGYVLFWLSSAGHKTTQFLERVIRREG